MRTGSRRRARWRGGIAPRTSAAARACRFSGVACGGGLGFFRDALLDLFFDVVAHPALLIGSNSMVPFRKNLPTRKRAGVHETVLGGTRGGPTTLYTHFGPWADSLGGWGGGARKDGALIIKGSDLFMTVQGSRRVSIFQCYSAKWREPPRRWPGKVKGCLCMRAIGCNLPWAANHREQSLPTAQAEEQDACQIEQGLQGWVSAVARIRPAAINKAHRYRMAFIILCFICIFSLTSVMGFMYK